MLIVHCVDSIMSIIRHSSNIIHQMSAHDTYNVSLRIITLADKPMSQACQFITFSLWSHIANLWVGARSTLYSFSSSTELISSSASWRDMCRHSWTFNFTLHTYFYIQCNKMICNFYFLQIRQFQAFIFIPQPWGVSITNDKHTTVRPNDTALRILPESYERYRDYHQARSSVFWQVYW